MSEPSRPRPVPGPPPSEAREPTAGERLEGLDERPLAEHVELFEAEHARLERELRTIDQL
ncbi:hypothetical protein [Trujillonella endophytica]|uniref:Uncharacterized protein n=1 Tax=Trujillonella endophytica TaxID=673521 RepID=A0A1H8T9H3_9ACTN|nr:hypothetical protein [Trujillella endophytica]SEO87148.1 hypothetical protein SAMN05660991_02139 [Trujillella endophytica]